MARIGRFVVPDLPHHVTQRGNRREKVFFGDDGDALYRDLLHDACRREGVAVWRYCLMSRHVHLILTPRQPTRDECGWGHCLLGGAEREGNLKSRMRGAHRLRRRPLRGRP